MSSLSYVHGACSTPLLGETIGDNFDRTVKRYGDREAVVVCHQQIRMSYSELKHAVDQCAASLLALGLTPGDRIGIWSPNNVEWVISQYATAKAGLILVNINPAYRASELCFVLHSVAAKALIFAGRHKTSDYLAMLLTIAPEIGTSKFGELRCDRLPHLRYLIQIGAGSEYIRSFSELLSESPPAAVDQLRQIQNEIQFDDPVNIQFTSGTTGRPKGATLSHFNILNNGYFAGRTMNFTEHDRLCIPVPLYHCFGMVLGNIACTTHGAAMIFPGDSFAPETVLHTIEQERCTALHGVPTMFIAELVDPSRKRRDLRSLRTGIMAGAPCPLELMNRVVTEMHMSEITIAYGMTETSPVSFQSSPEDPVEKRISTVGKIHPHVEAKIIDEHGRIVPAGTPGELLTRGYLVMRGYWGDHEHTLQVIDQAGWMHTGDQAIIDREGFCSIVGRLSDMIIRGGENVSPREIEEFLYSHPKIREVQVFGVADPQFGEEICAWIQLTADTIATEQEIRDFCRDNIAHYKIPRYIRFVQDYPMTVTGKIQKFRMKQAMEKELVEHRKYTR